MGGNAFFIYGKVRDDLLHARPLRRSIVDRLLGRVRTATPVWSQIGRDRRIIDLPSDALAALAVEFRDDVATRFDPAWTSTSAVLDYLRLDVMEVLARGDAAGTSAPEWYLQLSFSGCAGMAEVSSELSAHWAERWYREKKGDVMSRYFRPYGFEPNGRTEPDRSDTIFAPIGTAGYALYSATARDVDDEFPESRYFEIDNSATEMLSDADKSRDLGELDSALPPLLKGRGCCCQWCSPELDIAAFDRVALPFL